jgi:hypothetical protein
MGLSVNPQGLPLKKEPLVMHVNYCFCIVGLRTLACESPVEVGSLLGLPTHALPASCRSRGYDL